MRPQADRSHLPSPLRHAAQLLGVVFVAELAVTGLLYAVLGGASGVGVAVIDATAVTVILAAFIWWLMVRPLRRAATNGARWAEHLMDEAADPIVVINERGFIESSNAAATRAFGYDAYQMVGRNVSALMPPPPGEEPDRYIARFIATGEQRTIGRREVAVRRRDGTTFPAELSVSGWRADGQRKFTVTLRDLEGQWRAGEDARRVALALTQSADSVVITDRNGVILWVNWAFEQTSGYAKEEVIGGTPRILKSGKQDARFYEALWKTILAGKVFRGVVINRRKTGELYYVDQTITPIWDHTGQVAQFIASGKVLSEQ